MLGAIRWELLAVFATTCLAVALYGLAAAGHFPREHRAASFATPAGRLILWGSMTTAALAALAVLTLAIPRLPTVSTVIGGGLALLAAPLVLQRFPDSFVDGRRGLIVFAAAAAGLAALALRL